MLTQAQLKDLMRYCPDTGRFYWLKSGKGRRLSLIAGFPDSVGYEIIRIHGKNLKAHRLAWLYVHGAWPRDQIDHINGIKNDNRIVNLRDVSRHVNQQNKRKASRSNKLGILGVQKTGSKFRTSIDHGNKKLYLGVHLTAQAAQNTYIAAKRALHPGCTI